MLTWNEVLRLSKNGNPTRREKIVKTLEQWRELLDEETFRVTRKGGTERPFSHSSCQTFEPGKYQCACCGELLFDSQQKFDSGTGWPSFTQPIETDAIGYHADYGQGMIRIEVVCNRCEAHLGHVFPDGPPPGGLRYCINGVGLRKLVDATQNDQAEPDQQPTTAESSESKLQTMTVGGGCFWCTEAIFQQVTGVISVTSGYSGGQTNEPTYYQVCSGDTGHAEVVQLVFDPTVISFEELLRIHLATHDPTTLNRQGADRGTQYRSIVFYRSPEEAAAAKAIIEEVQAILQRPVVTEIAPFERFFAAEAEHQNYYRRNPGQGYCAAVIEPKLNKFKQKFLPLLKSV